MLQTTNCNGFIINFSSDSAHLCITPLIDCNIICPLIALSQVERERESQECTFEMKKRLRGINITSVYQTQIVCVNKCFWTWNKKSSPPSSPPRCFLWPWKNFCNFLSAFSLLPFGGIFFYYYESNFGWKETAKKQTLPTKIRPVAFRVCLTKFRLDQKIVNNYTWLQPWKKIPVGCSFQEADDEDENAGKLPPNLE